MPNAPLPDVSAEKLSVLLGEIVDFALAITDAEFGNIQLVEPETGNLKIRAQRGFPDWWVDYWNNAGMGQGSCHAASRHIDRTIIDDVERSEVFAGTPGLEVQLRAGVRACQSTPIVSRSGTLLGMFSTHWTKPCCPDQRTLMLLDRLALQASHIIELAQTEAALERTNAMFRSSEARYRTLVEQAVDGIFLADPSGRYIDVNDAGAAMLGYTREDICKLSVKDVLHPEELARLPEQFAELASGAIVTSEWKFRRRDNSTFTGELVGRLLPDGRLLGVLRDVTVRRQAENAVMSAKLEAEKANAAKSHFLAAASHDLRQPLAALTLYVDTLKIQIEPRHQPLLGSMRDCITNLGELLSDLLDISKLDAGVVTPTISSFSVGSLFETLAPVHLPVARKKKLRLRFVASRRTAQTDLVLFRRMLGNLIDNAIRCTDAGGVLVGCRRRQGKMWVEVWDSGIGIPDDKTEEIFEDFKQLDDGRRTRGSGLGLAIVARTAALLGLQVRVRSRHGAGSLFAIELPPGEDLVPASVEARQKDQRKLCVALVEDNVAVRMAMTSALESTGHEVIAVECGSDLNDACYGRLPDIVLTDYRLANGETGLDVIAIARRLFGENLPALVITGETGTEFMRTMAERGVEVVHKPVELDDLIARLLEMTGNSKQSDGLTHAQVALLEAKDLDGIVQVAKRAARRITGADGACFVLREDGMCHYLDEDAIGPLWKGQRFPMSTCISGWVMEHREPAAIEDIYLDARIPLEAYRKTFVHSLLAVPLGTVQPSGALVVYWSIKRPPTAQEKQELLSLADMTAAAMNRVEQPVV